MIRSNSISSFSWVRILHKLDNICTGVFNVITQLALFNKGVGESWWNYGETLLLSSQLGQEVENNNNGGCGLFNRQYNLDTY